MDTRSEITEDSGVGMSSRPESSMTECSQAESRKTESNLTDTYFSDPEDATSDIRNQGVNTDSSLLYRPTSKLVARRPPWKKYWRADPGLPVTNHAQGPFRETALQAPLEARNLNQSPYISTYTIVSYQMIKILWKRLNIVANDAQDAPGVKIDCTPHLFFMDLYLGNF